MEQSVLMVYIEPTPYVLGFIRHTVQQHGGGVESVFIAANVSQPWNLTLDIAGASFLPPGAVSAAIEIYKRVSSKRVALLHLAGWGHPLLIWALMVGWLRSVPVVIESDTPLPVTAPFWKNVLKQWLYPMLFRVPRMVLPAGSRQANYFRHYGVEERRIVKAQMTVDVAEIMTQSDAIRRAGAVSALRSAFGVPAGSTVFVFIGRLQDPRKGIRVLLEAFADVSRRRQNVALLIGGDGPERPAVEAAAAADARIRCAGRLDWDAVVSALSCADVAIVPSLLEPFGLVVNEAMAAGLPVIASDCVGCVDDLVVHDETGLVFPVGNVAQLAASMLSLADAPAERRRMGAAARRLIAGWTLQEQARISVNVWNDVLKR